MGQKVSPIGLRLGINKGWDSTWYAPKDEVAKYIKEDNEIRKFVKKNYASCGISKIEIERTKNKLVVNIYTGRPGMIIGAKGVGIEQFKANIAKIIAPTKNLFVNVCYY